ncbi:MULTISPECIES: (3R)-3-[(carboxymethyl)amino]fatty acid oxygenase/decarboxylase [Streptomyces]|uniref:TauD/TfdA dioxygenase family protein n=1 Tax=Streptomyces ardesiacus TaxID=285564 RepID=A0ABW8HKD4_9ACTN|nr:MULTISPECIES: TauD/TfdA family dioxygenase [Streptomyces]NEB62595.1 TauD/TfdA family dioxygenase [Streptomyces diastaticus]KOT94793.1 dioxygenase [Streptomyces sp. NRRL F-4711]KOX28536.1 dioxygenase [Streptomyces sp. NRRL F-4707]KOX44183.1 dioxygenase [Streptomyces sp. NRRL F-7442]MCL7370309.1 TauD/TfdA family dioxygenase [Streptomyces ardesiacus]
MRIQAPESSALGVEIHDFDPRSASEQEIAELLHQVYTAKIVVLKGQDLDSPGFIDLGRRLGEIDVYYEPMYHHPEYREIFVSSNVPADGKQIGVPKTGKFWHADYQFMPRPFGLTLIYPQVIPKENRGTYFIDMGRAYESLPQDLKDAIAGTRAEQSPRRYFKIRPSDVYRPVSELLEEIERKTPAVKHPTTFTHPVTGETVLYISEGFTCALENEAGERLDDSLVPRLLEATGQLDPECTHPLTHLQTYEEGDLLVWDNRSLIHRALHTTTPEPAVSHRVTVHDAHPFFAGTGA